MAVFLGIGVAMAFGSGDFLGGRASRHASTLAVLVLGQFVAVAGALVVALLVGARVGTTDLAYGAAAGIATAGGLALLYYGLAHYRIGVVAPLTAVVGALVPVGWALVRGERPSPMVLIGAACAIVAGGVIAREPDETAETAAASGAGIALAAGALLGTSLVFFAETSDRSGLWPVFSARCVSLVAVTLAVAVMARRTSPRFPTGPARGFALGAGALDVAGTTMVVLAVRRGLLVVVAPIAALAPAFTVVLAWLVLRERVTRAQLGGLALALVGLVLVASG